MKPVMIIENSTNSLIRESIGSGKKDYILSGIFTELGIKNRNERVYTADKFLPALEELNERIKSFGVVYGEYDHPDVFDTSLSRASHIITKTSYVKESNLVKGEIKLLSTTYGKEARALVDDGCPVFVSSRAAGVTEANGFVTLKKLFTYDIVADPGFASAKMSVTCLNESLGYQNNTNFRIYEMSDESKINQLFDMNKNDFVTKGQITDYSKYLVNELASVKKEVKKALNQGKLEPKEMSKLLEYYEELNKTNSQVIKYLDYLADKIQIVVNENKSLKSTTDKIIRHNDYLAENLEKSINYSEYVAENLDKNIAYSEYIAENLDKNIAYSEYIAENLDKGIAYSEYIAENLDKNIAYSEYIAENLDKNIAYSEYIAENLDDNIAYSEYIAESLDKGISYTEMIAEKLNSKSVMIKESTDDKGVWYFPSPDEFGFESQNEIENTQSICDEDDIYCIEDEEEVSVKEFEFNDENLEEDEFNGNDDTELSESINKLIEEAKKRKVSETSDLNFLKFLTKSQIDDYYSLSTEDQETVKLYINEKSYFSGKDVLKLISESLSTKTETLEERIIRLMPTEVKPLWSGLNESEKRSILSQARLYPTDVLTNEGQIENFWATRNFNKKESTKKLISNDIIQNDKLSNNDISSIMERIKNI